MCPETPKRSRYNFLWFLPPQLFFCSAREFILHAAIRKTPPKLVLVMTWIVIINRIVDEIFTGIDVFTAKIVTGIETKAEILSIFCRYLRMPGSGRRFLHTRFQAVAGDPFPCFDRIADAAKWFQAKCDTPSAFLPGSAEPSEVRKEKIIG
jgi:hypothetical protein